MQTSYYPMGYAACPHRRLPEAPDPKEVARMSRQVKREGSSDWWQRWQLVASVVRIAVDLLEPWLDHWL